MGRNDTTNNSTLITAWVALNGLLFVFGVISLTQKPPNPQSIDWDRYTHGSSPYGWSPVTGTLQPLLPINIIAVLLYFAVKWCIGSDQQAAVVPAAPRRPEIPPTGAGGIETFFPRLRSEAGVKTEQVRTIPGQPS